MRNKRFIIVDEIEICLKTPSFPEQLVGFVVGFIATLFIGGLAVYLLALL